MILLSLHKRVIDYIQTHPDEFGCKFLRQCAVNTGQSLESYILSLPASAMIQVRDYVPLAFPRKLRKPELQAHRCTNGAWLIRSVEVRENFSEHPNR